MVIRCVLMCVGKRNVDVVFFFFQAEDGIRDLVRSRGLGDVYKRQVHLRPGPGACGALPREPEGLPGSTCRAGRERGGPVSYTHLTLPTIYPV